MEKATIPAPPPRSMSDANIALCELTRLREENKNLRAELDKIRSEK